MKVIRNEWYPPINVIELKQSNYNFYVFKMNAIDLLRISYTSPRTKLNRKGIQRGLDRARLKEIGEYIQNIKHGEKNKTPNILPNAIIVNFSEKTKCIDGKLHIYNPQNGEGEAFVLDGQHRLFAFDPEFSKGISFDLVIAGFIGLKDEESAYLFKVINEKQKKINPSLVYDLIPMLRKEWVPFEDQRCNFFIEELNSDELSPWYDGISLLGGREKPITQSSFITRLKSLFKQGRIFHNQKENDEFYFSTIQKTLLFEFFKALKEIYPEAWLNRNFILCKNTGVGVMLNLLDEIIKFMKKRNMILVNDRGLSINKSDFFPFIKKLKPFNFGGNYGKLYLGEAGIRELTSELSKKIFN